MESEANPSTAIPSTNLRSGNKYRCEICKKQFRAFSIFMKHVQSGCTSKCPQSSKQRYYSCEVCGTACKYLASMETHMLMHKNKKLSPHKPNRANENCEDANLNDTNKELYICGVCGKRYSCEFALKGHMREHITPEEHQCEVCQEIFRWPSELYKHMRTHTPDDSVYCCDSCEKYYRTSAALMEHLYTHTYPKLTTCKVCGKTLQLPSLKYHMLKHSKEESTKYINCKKKQTDSGKLEEHIKTHSENEQYEPSKKETSDYESFEQDMHYIHTSNSEKAFACHVCGTRFRAQRAFKKHMQGVHSGKTHHRCDVCGKYFVKVASLKLHKYLHCGAKTYFCKVCGRCFILEKAYNEHKVTHTKQEMEIRHRCMICNKNFGCRSTLNIHMNKHTGHKPYKCETCGEAYTAPESLLAHKRLHLLPHPPAVRSPIAVAQNDN